MQRSDFLTRVISAVVFLAIAVYVGIYIYQYVTNPFQTSLAVSYTVDESVSVSGYIVRDEELVYGSTGNAVVLATDLKKVSGGSAIAVEYSSTEALERAAEIRELELQIEQAEESLKNGSSASASVLELAEVLDSRNFDEIDSATLAVQSSTFSAGEDVSSEELEIMKAELSALEEESSADTSTVTAPASGLFSTTTDGFENICIEDVKELSISEMESLFDSPRTVSSTCVGKLVYGMYWYYAAVIDADSGLQLNEGDKETLYFTDLDISIEMTVYSVGSEENGERLVIFTASEKLSLFAGLREAEAELVTEDYTGLKVPKEAVHLDTDDENESVTYIYIVSGVQAERVDVEIIGQVSGNYIVSSDGELRQGAEIIVKCNNLFDGKVVR